MLSRRELFKNGFQDAARSLFRGARVVGRTLATDAARPSRPVQRPPGALDERAFLAACTRCDDCLLACPRLAIKKAGPELGQELAGTPVVLPVEQPCWMCEDMPCIAACGAGALVPLERIGQARMGSVRVDAATCYAAAGSLCDVCAERCPVQPRAIEVGRGVAPVVDPDTCTGCGVCAWLCPPRALEVLPRGVNRRAGAAARAPGQMLVADPSEDL